MRLSLTNVFIFGALLFGLTSSPARAEELTKISVTFPFLVNDHMLPAGQYEIRRDDQDPAILMLVGIDHTRAHAIVASIVENGGDPASHDPALTFVWHGNVWQLSEVRETRDYARQVVLHVH